MRILSASIFLSFLAGKLRHFEQLLLIALKNKFKENWRMRIFSKFFGGKIKSFEQRFALKNVSKKQHKNSILFLYLS